MHLTIRPAIVDDAAVVLAMLRAVFTTTDKVLTTPQELNLTLEQEIAFIKKMNSSENSVLLLAFADTALAGVLGFEGGTKNKIRHTGEMGISVHPDYQNKGVGAQLIAALLTWAKENPIVKKINLSVMEHNHNGIHLYQKLGFKQEGRRHKEIFNTDGKYYDIIEMSQWVE